MAELRGIRGAINVGENTKESILSATKELLLAIVRENDIEVTDIASIFFTATDDLNAEYPAYAARDLGWTMVPMLCAHEMNVPQGMKMLIRVLIHINTTKSQNQIRHQYLGDTVKLRPDLLEVNNDDNCNEV